MNEQGGNHDSSVSYSDLALTSDSDETDGSRISVPFERQFEQLTSRVSVLTQEMNALAKRQQQSSLLLVDIPEVTEIEDFQAKCAETENTIRRKHITIAQLDERIENLKDQRQEATEEIHAMQEMTRQDFELDDVNTMSLYLQSVAKKEELEGEVQDVRSKTVDLNIETQRVTGKMVDVADRAWQAAIRHNELEQELLRVNQQRQELWVQVQQLREQYEGVTSKLRLIQEMRDARNDTMMQFTRMSEKLRLIYQVEARYNSLLPSLINMDSELEHVDVLLDKFERKMDLISENEDEDIEAAEEKFLRLRRRYDKLCFKVKLRRQKFISWLLADDLPQIVCESRESSREMELKRKLAEVQSDVETLRVQIRKEKEYHQKLQNCYVALESKTKRKNEELCQLCRRISEAEVQAIVPKPAGCGRRRSRVVTRALYLERVQYT